MRIVLAILATLLVASSAHAQQPNILLLIADDMHYSEIGSPVSKTPNLDRLAAESAVFTHGYVPNSVCRPSLSTLLTGSLPTENGIVHHLVPTLSPSGSLVEALKNAGYATRCEAKWWEGDALAFGFDEEGLPHMGSNTQGTPFVREKQTETLEFIERCAANNQPWFIWWAPQLPHLPHDPLPRYLDEFPASTIPVPSWFTGSATEYREAERKYQAMVYWMDEGVGEILGRLALMGQLENTLVVYLSDNGWITGLPGKSTPYEAGVRTPIMFSWKGKIVPQKHTRLTETRDIMPTILDYAGLPIPASVTGTSLRPVLEGQSVTPPPVVYGFNQGHSQTDGAFAYWARTSDGHKYVKWIKTTDQSYEDKFWLYSWVCPNPLRQAGQEELFDLSSDPNELTDISQTWAGRQKLLELRQSAEAWWTSQGEPTPPPSPSGLVIDETDSRFAIVSGSWGQGIVGYRSRNRWAASGDGSAKARWTIPVESGKTYKLAVTWPPATNRATNAPFTIINGTEQQAFAVNQEQAPADFQDGGMGWKDLGTYTVQGTSLIVELTNAANEYVIADAVRIEEVE